MDETGNASVVVLAAGNGSRLSPLTDCTPKPLVQIGGPTGWDYVLSNLLNSGIYRVRVMVKASHAEDFTKHRDRVYGPKINAQNRGFIDIVTPASHAERWPNTVAPVRENLEDIFMAETEVPIPAAEPAYWR